MDMKSGAKVGFFVVAAVLLLGSWILYLSHIKPNAYVVRVTFRDVKGLVPQSFVRMQGVVIGEVRKVDLDTDNLTADGRFPNPLVTLSIENKYRIPKDSTFRIVSGLLITNPTVEITPGRERQSLSHDNSARVAGAESGGALEAISPELQQTVTKLNGSFDDLNKKIKASYAKIDKMLDTTHDLLKNSNATIVGAKGLITDPTLKPKLLKTLDNFEQASGQARLASSQIRVKLNTILDSGKGTFDETKEQLLNIFDRIDTTLDDANTVVKKLTEQVTDPRLQQSLQETIELARTTLARFNQLASDLHQFTGDPLLQQDLKQTITNLKNASQQGEEAVGKVNSLLGNVPGTGGKKPNLRFPPINLTANVSEQFDPSRLRVDLEARVPLGQRSFFDIGAYDLESSRLILQGGSHLSSNLTARYGVYASRLGAGLEWNPSQNVQIRGDLWDANHPRLDLRTSFRVNKNASFWVGTDGLFRRPVPRIGIELRP